MKLQDLQTLLDKINENNYIMYVCISPSAFSDTFTLLESLGSICLSYHGKNIKVDPALKENEVLIITENGVIHELV